MMEGGELPLLCFGVVRNQSRDRRRDRCRKKRGQQRATRELRALVKIFGSHVFLPMDYHTTILHNRESFAIVPGGQERLPGDVE